MGTGNERKQLESELAEAMQEFREAEEAIHPSKIQGNQPPNEALFVRVESARATVLALERAIQALNDLK
ncbi:hypothetical protein K8353_38045 [Burkholderia contaminans]|nr:hypothetical protein [Burkholderia contaminans]